MSPLYYVSHACLISVGPACKDTYRGATYKQVASYHSKVYQTALADGSGWSQGQELQCWWLHPCLLTKVAPG